MSTILNRVRGVTRTFIRSGVSQCTAAHHDHDPIFGQMRALRMKKQGAHIAQKCAKCHTPRAPSAPNSLAGKTGVSCAACHQVKAVHLTDGKVGVDTLVYDKDGVMRAGRVLPQDASPVHRIGKPLGAMTDGKTLCLSCHNATKTPSGAAACTTGPEYASSAMASEQTCVSCHMPEVAGPAGAVGRQDKHRSHQFLGPHRAWYQNDPSILKRAVTLNASVVDQRTALIELKNLSAHAFPSGFPGRMVVLKLVGLDKDKQVIWQNFTKNALAQSPQSVINKVYHDKNKRPVPAAFSHKLARDNRLKADEVRQLRYKLPQQARAVEIKLLYFLMPPPLAKKLNLQDSPEAKPTVLFSKTLPLP